jgi:tetratricopeptide (TPR) repeat protein
MISEIGVGLFAIGVLLIVALAATNGSAEPGSQALALLLHGNTEERRDAVETLIRLGDQRAVEPLAKALHDNDALVRQLSEQALWQLWHRSGNTHVDTRLQAGIDAMQRGAFEHAVAIFTQVVEGAPNFAEGYNKRATTYYLMQDYEKSIADCDRTIALNPVHFGAMSGAGLCYLGLRDLHKALTYFERAVAVNPNLEQIKHYIEEIRKFFRDQSF